LRSRKARVGQGALHELHGGKVINVGFAAHHHDFTQPTAVRDGAAGLLATAHQQHH